MSQNCCQSIFGVAVKNLVSAHSCSSQTTVPVWCEGAEACRKQTRSSDKYFFQMDTPSALGGSATEKDYSPLYLPNPLPPPASSIFPPFLLPSLPRRFPLQILPFSSCHCVQFVPEISPSNKGQIMTKRLCFCVYAIVCACVCFFTPAFCLCIFPVWLSFHDLTISSCTSLLFVSFYICVWPSIMLSSCMIFLFFFTISPSQTLLHRICLAPSKRKREMRGLSSFLLSFFSLFTLITFHSSSASLFLSCDVSF